MESYETSEGDAALRSAILRRLQQFILDPALETRAAFDEFVVDKRRARNAVAACESFLSTLQNLKLTYTTDDSDRQELRDALKQVEEYCKSMSRALEGRDEPLPKNVSEE